MMPYPIAQYAIEPTEKSIRFFMIMFTAFLALVKPASTIANPACMKKTRKAAIRVHTVSIATVLDAAVGPSAKAMVVPKHIAKIGIMVKLARLIGLPSP